MMDKPSELHQIQEPEVPAKRAILHLSAVRRPPGPAEEVRPVGPWPRQVARRTWYLRRRPKKIGV